MTALSNAVSAANNIKEDKEGRARQNMVQNISRVVDPESKLCGHRKYGYGFLLYLLLNIANVVFNVWLMNTFLGGDFLNLGIKYSLLLNVDKYYKYELLLKISKWCNEWYKVLGDNISQNDHVQVETVWYRCWNSNNVSVIKKSFGFYYY